MSRMLSRACTGDAHRACTGHHEIFRAPCQCPCHGQVLRLTCQLWDWADASDVELAAREELRRRGEELVAWDDSIRVACSICARGCRVGPRQQQARAFGDLEVYCFTCAVLASDGPASFTDLGNPQV